MGYGLDGRDFSPVSRRALRPTQAPAKWVPGTHALGVKRSRFPSSAEAKNGGAIILHPVSLHAVVLE
jgi:hypothetical protein